MNDVQSMCFGQGNAWVHKGETWQLLFLDDGHIASFVEQMPAGEHFYNYEVQAPSAFGLPKQRGPESVATAPNWDHPMLSTSHPSHTHPSHTHPLTRCVTPLTDARTARCQVGRLSRGVEQERLQATDEKGRQPPHNGMPANQVVGARIGYGLPNCHQSPVAAHMVRHAHPCHALPCHDTPLSCTPCHDTPVMHTPVMTPLS